MNTKPILFWPKSRSKIERTFDQGEADFLVVDTNGSYDLQRLYKLRPDNLVLDPFPGHGAHYRDFSDHVAASDCRCHVVGLEACRDVLAALQDPSLARSPNEELLSAMAVPCGTAASLPVTRQRTKTPVDWSHLNWANTSLLATLVFVAALVGNVFFFDNGFRAAVVATVLFAGLYGCVRARFSDLLSTVTARSRTSLAAWRQAHH